MPTRRGYSYFDPQQYVAQNLEQNPWYNPLSPSADILGGIRGTLNMMWGLKESARERKEEEEKTWFEQQQEERRTKVQEREAAARLMPKPESLSEWEAEWQLIDTLPYSEDVKTQLRLGEITIADIEAKPTPGAVRAMQEDGIDPSTAKPNQISAYNEFDMQMKDDVARKEDRDAWKAGDAARQTQARNITLLRKYQDDLGAEAERLAEEIEAAVKSKQYSREPRKELRKGEPNPYTGKKAKEGEIIPVKGYKEYEAAVARHKRVLDVKKSIYDYIGMVDMGGVLQSEDMAQLTSQIQEVMPGSATNQYPPDFVYLMKVNKWTSQQAAALYQQYLQEQQGGIR